MRYIDTSAFVKYYGSEEFEKGINKISEIIENAKQGNEILVSSIFIIWEAISVFDRWVRIKAITKEELNEIIKRFLKDIKELVEKGNLILDPVNSLVIIFSSEFIIKHNITINDAIHLYTALTYIPEVKEFICSDKILNKAVKEEGLITFDPEEEW